MFESPRSLQAICFDFICKNLLALCEVYADVDDERTASMESSSNLPAIGINSANAASKLRFKRFIKDQDVVLPGKISEPLLTSISETKAFDDLTMTLFGSKNTRLKHVRIKDAVRLSIKGLMVLKQHDIVDLEVNRLIRITIHDLITCLSDWSLMNLKSLSVANGNLTKSSSVSAFPALSNLPALQILNVSGTEFDSHDLALVVENLLYLESLDISRTRVDDITPLKKCKDRWKTLVMRNLETNTYEKSHAVFHELNELRTLDISVERCGCRATKTKANDLLAAVDCMPHLTSLDISGELIISTSKLSMFIKAHPRLSFLGLLQTCVYGMGSLINPNDPDYKPDLRVSGVANEIQIIESLKRYSDRPTYLEDCLRGMSFLLDGNMRNRVDLIKLIIPIMQVHTKELNLQVQGVACLYNLVKEELIPQIHPSVLQQTVDVTLNAMASCSDNEILQARCLVIMKNDQILETATFDKYRFATLLIPGLLRFSNRAFDAMCVEIVSKLSSTMSLLETSALGSSSFVIHRLLSFVRFKMSSKCADTIMGFAMSAVRDLTNRSSQSCNIFLGQGGMEVYLEALKTFPEESRIKTTILGLFNNIAEFSEFRQRLMRSEFMKMLPLLMDSEQIDVSYHAAGIAAYLLSDGSQTWTEDPSMPTKTQLLDQLAKTVVTWQTPEYEIIAYRSFIPFFPLLRSTEPYPVQLWAVWAIHHACKENPKTYCRILKSESGDEILKSLEKDGVSETQPYVRRLFRSILDTLELHPS